jgi:hypothetical protein
MEPLPIHYRLEIYEGSYAGRPVMTYVCGSPLPAMAVGDLFDTRSFSPGQDPPPGGEIYRIREICHDFWVAEGSHVAYTAMICLEDLASTGGRHSQEVHPA